MRKQPYAEEQLCMRMYIVWYLHCKRNGHLLQLNMPLALTTADLVGYGSLRQSPCLKGSVLAIMEGGRGMCLTADCELLPLVFAGCLLPTDCSTMVSMAPLMSCAY